MAEKVSSKPSGRKRPAAKQTGPSLAEAVKPFLAGAAANRADAMARAAKAAGEAPAFAKLARKNPALTEFLGAVMEASPFLRALMLEDIPRLLRLLAGEPLSAAAAIAQRTRGIWRGADEAGLMRDLRLARNEIALLLGLADLGAVLGVEEVTRLLSEFAASALAAAAAFLLHEAHDSGQLALAEPDRPEEGCGWIILGMGKFGAGELNYSSDIDLIVFYEREIAPLSVDIEPSKFFVSLTKRLVKLLNERTEDGYVFRVDLRLRPDPGSTPIALSTMAALQYYEGRGQNWERAALIKARPIAGDLAVGALLLKELGPYIWRKYLDFAAISDIHSIKRQIHDHRGHGEIAVAGHNLKLGRGGIREIEFFVQTQQLIAGGREIFLRGRSTLEMLAMLASFGWITDLACQELSACYRLLRSVEHRLQMVADEQTHTLPEEGEALENIAHLCGHKSAAALASALIPVLETVRDHYQRLFEAAPSLSAEIGSLVFTGDEDDPETLATLSRLGFVRPQEVTKAIRSWHFGRYPAMRSSAARERLTEITPLLLKAIADTGNADVAFAAFDRFLARLPAGVQLFALLGSNPGLLDLLAMIMGAAPRLTETIIHRAHVLDALIEPAFFGGLPDRALLASRLEAALEEAAGTEDLLDRARIFGQEQEFLVSARQLVGTAGPQAAARAYSDLAELMVDALLTRVRKDFQSVHGSVPGGQLCLLAMGKLGSREMSAASDLDLILLYDFTGEMASSNGAKPLDARLYFARLTQRLVAALSVQTGEGTLYAVDFRLRPSGNAGPLATRFSAFAHYQAKEAWTWEHMALTRARPIAGDEKLCRAAEREIHKILGGKRDRKKTVADILEMRATLAKEKGGGGAWDLKQAEGGLIDIEFIAQGLQLLHGAKHREILNAETESALQAAARLGVLPLPDADSLLFALRLFQSQTQLIRLCLSGPFDGIEAPKPFLELLARAAGLPDFARLDALVRDSERDVRSIFERVLGKLPGAA